VTTLSDETHKDVHPRRQVLALVLALAATLPGVVVRLGHIHLSDPVAALLFGVAIVGAAFLMAWAAEVAQLDISAGLAIALLALIAVLPEYAVGFVFAGKGGHAFKTFGAACQSKAAVAAGSQPPCSLALANMTGANRLLIGLGWSMVVFVAWRQYRKRGQRVTEVRLERSHSVEISFLALACGYCLILPFKKTISLIDAAVLVAIFVMYSIRVSKAPAETPHLVGPARYIGGFAVARRRAAVVAMLVVAAAVIVLCADHFADALVASGRTLGVSDFLLVQWLAPIASEAPELLVAGLYAWRLNTNAGLGTLVSSKVNQWTLLVGTLPVVFVAASGSLHGLPITSEPRLELLLTAAQSVFAVAVLVNLAISNKEALALFGLFVTQFALGAISHGTAHDVQRIAYSALYLVMAAVLLIRQRVAFVQLLRDGFRAPYSVLSEPR
jgi:cation:H+ antiporter